MRYMGQVLHYVKFICRKIRPRRNTIHSWNGLIYLAFDLKSHLVPNRKKDNKKNSRSGLSLRHRRKMSKPKMRLTITADDFGYCPERNRAIRGRQCKCFGSDILISIFGHVGTESISDIFVSCRFVCRREDKSDNYPHEWTFSSSC